MPTSTPVEVVTNWLSSHPVGQQAFAGGIGVSRGSIALPRAFRQHDCTLAEKPGVVVEGGKRSEKVVVPDDYRLLGDSPGWRLWRS